MGKKLIDCTLTIDNAYGWVEFPRAFVYGRPNPPVKVEAISTVKANRVANFFLQMTTQTFTHIESKFHFYEDGRTIEQVPLEWFINDGVVIDMMHKEPGEGVTAADLEKAQSDIRSGDTVIIRTGWTDKCFGTREFWEKMIYLDEDACDWLLERKPRALMQDFMTDIKPLNVCNCCGGLVPESKWEPNHFKFLGADMLLIEWCTNLGAIKNQRVRVIALPLKIRGTEGGPARVVVEEDD